MKRQPPKRPFEIHRSLPSHRPSTKQPPTEDHPESSGWRDWRRWALVIGSGLIAFGLFIGIWDSINLSRASSQLFGSGNLFSLMGRGKLKGSPSGRVNVLLVGYSVDDPGHPGSKLTDSIILLSLGAGRRSSYMLSIPRDLYVNIPGFGHAKINEAYGDGGMKLLSRVVSQDFGVPIDYHVLINYGAVRNLVNALGGVDVQVKSPDKRGLYDPNINKHDGGPLRLKNGWQHLDGQTALNLTRARGDDYRSYGFPQADFDRTEHQRQVLNAIKAKLSWWLIINPLKNGKVAQALAKNIRTDIKANQARPLFGLFNSVPDSQLQSIGLRNVNHRNLLASYNANGESALIPAAGLDNFSQIQSAIKQLDK